MTVSKTYTFVNKGHNAILDLNGFTLSKQVNAVTQYAATYDAATGEYVKGEALGAKVVTGKSSSMFYINSNGFTFNLKSSRPGAVMSNVYVTASQWICDGKVVNTEASLSIGGTFFNLYPSSSTFNIYGENISFYGGTLFYAEHGGNGKEKVTIDGGTFYALDKPAESILAFRNGEKVSIKNATFYGNSATLIKNRGDNRNLKTNITFDNCNIYNAGINSQWENDVYTFNNCRLAISIDGGCLATIILGENTRITTDLTASNSYYSAAKVADGLSLKASSKTIYFDSSASANLTIDPETLIFNGAIENVQSRTFAYAVVDADKETALVTWKDAQGNILTVTEELKNTLAIAPKAPWGDGFRGVMNATWLDANGNESDLMLGDADSYEFTAVLPEEEDAWFVAQLTDAMLNMTYYAHFAYNLYIPVVEGINVTKIAGKVPTNTVLIYGREYYIVNGGYVDSTGALVLSSSNVEYTIDGVNYSTAIKYDALLYAKLASTDPNSSEIEKEAVACLVRYIHESYKYVDADHVLDDATEAKFQDYYKNYRTPAPYATEYPSKAVHTVNETAIDGLIESITFTTVSSRVCLAVTLTDEAVAAGYKVFFSGIGWGNEYNIGSKTFYTNNRPLYKYLMVDKYTITVVDKDNKDLYRDLDGDGTAETLAATSYSMPTYITVMEAKGQNVDLVKALYDFGTAVLKVRESIYK